MGEPFAPAHQAAPVLAALAPGLGSLVAWLGRSDQPPAGADNCAGGDGIESRWCRSWLATGTRC